MEVREESKTENGAIDIYENLRVMAIISNNFETNLSFQLHVQFSI